MVALKKKKPGCGPGFSKKTLRCLEINCQDSGLRFYTYRLDGLNRVVLFDDGSSPF